MNNTINTDSTPPRAHLEGEGGILVLNDLRIKDLDVCREAQRWTTGERGPVVDDVAALSGADMTNFVAEALRIGALALSASGQAREAQAFESMLQGVQEQSAASAKNVVESTAKALEDASTTIERAAKNAKDAIAEVDQKNRKEFSGAVSAATLTLQSELRRLLGGDHPELVEKLQPVLDRFSTELDARATKSATDLIGRVARTLDPSDPTSPMAKQAAMLDAKQQVLVTQIHENHGVVLKELGDLATAMRVQQAQSELTRTTPKKGVTYEEQVQTLMDQIAGGLGDEYEATGSIQGRLPRCKKGDGVLHISGEDTRVVLEMTDSKRTTWADYLDEAERNRDAVAALGLVPTPEQNGNQHIRMIGPRRIVMAFDPMTGDADLLRTVVLLLRTAAVAAASRSGAAEISTAEEKIVAALDQLATIDEIKKSAATIKRSADSIDGQCSSTASTIRRLLSEAQTALAGVDTSAGLQSAA